MSGKKRTNNTKPPKSSDGWIQKKKGKYEFAPVTHASRSDFPSKETYYSTSPTKSNTKNDVSVKNTTGRVINPYKVTPTKKSNSSVSKDTPTPFSLIKKENKLYFSYDPRGYPTDPLPDNYCMFCRCPMVYCCEIVFGQMSLDAAETLAYTPGPHCTEERSDMKELFDRAFTKLVFAKIKFNDIDLGVEATKKSFYALKIPKCMKRKSLRRFYAKNEANNYPDDYGEDDWDEEKEEEELKLKGEWTTEHPIMKKTALKQSQDITEMFKKIKKMVKDKEASK